MLTACKAQEQRGRGFCLACLVSQIPAYPGCADLNAGRQLHLDQSSLFEDCKTAATTRVGLHSALCTVESSLPCEEVRLSPQGGLTKGHGEAAQSDRIRYFNLPGPDSCEATEAGRGRSQTEKRTARARETGDNGVCQVQIRIGRLPGRVAQESETYRLVSIRITRPIPTRSKTPQLTVQILRTAADVDRASHQPDIRSVSAQDEGSFGPSSLGFADCTEAPPSSGIHQIPKLQSRQSCSLRA